MTIRADGSTRARRKDAGILRPDRRSPDVCADCRIVRDLQLARGGNGTISCRYHARKRSQAWRDANREKMNEYNRTRAKLDDVKRRTRNRLLLKRYGITLEQYEEMLALQDGRCKICKRLPVNDKSEPVIFFVDHCHATFRVRGILCFSCNRHRVGKARDTEIEMYQRIVEYLSSDFDGRLLKGASDGGSKGQQESEGRSERTEVA